MSYDKDDKDKEPKMGDFNTFYKYEPKGNYGHGNTIVGATDNNGNTIITQQTAVGFNAKAGPNSIAIGAFAGAGSDLFHLLQKLEHETASRNNEDEVKVVNELTEELKSQEPDRNRIKVLWATINTFKWVGEVAVLIHEIAQLIQSHLK